MSCFLYNVYKYGIVITTINNGNNIYSDIGIYGTQKYIYKKQRIEICRYMHVRMYRLWAKNYEKNERTNEFNWINGKDNEGIERLLTRLTIECCCLSMMLLLYVAVIVVVGFYFFIGVEFCLSFFMRKKCFSL